MNKATKTTLTILRRAIGYGFLVTVVSLISTAIYVLEQREDLSIWHEVDLDEEFDRFSGVKDFKGYLKLEERVFQQLEDEVYAKTSPGDRYVINRYRKGSLSDPTSMPEDWNRSFEMTREEPESGVLLLHGLSDSPYSLRALGESFHEAGAYVVGLRIPGHGTVPSGLVEVSWKDWAAAVRLAVLHLKEQVGDKPIQLVGYSNGGALAVNYSLKSLDDKSMPRPDGLLLISPEIGLSKTAALAVWQGRVGHWLGLEKLAWNSIGMEYDPHKYCSFAINAGDQAHRITTEIDKQLGKLSKKGQLGDFPRVLAFQSCADATVLAPALVSRLFDRLPDAGHELVIFDVNRNEVIEHLLAKNPEKDIRLILDDRKRLFSVSLITNLESDAGIAPEVIVKYHAAGSSEVVVEQTGFRWPNDVYSLSHVALPFPESDPFYGSGGGGKRPTLGNLALRGEKGTLYISSKEMLRQKWNPFFPWMEGKSLEFLGLKNGGN